ncbi:MAG: hypothetical protein KC657_12410 [Myxococcales bacterium]|nr:hypothetical protein [Myxococcales bacterium]
MRRIAPAALLALASSIAAFGTGCSAQEVDAADADQGEIVQAPSRGPKVCAAVRGNGHYVVTHFASLARIVEHYGVVDGMAGGSSGSLSTFIYDSMLKNDAIRSCSGKRCSEAQHAARLALALKSVQGYAEAVGGSDEAASIGQLVGTAMKLKAEVDARGIAGLADSDTAEAARQLKEVLAIPEVKAIINPEITAMLADTEHLAFNVKEIQTSITTLGAFSVDDNRLFFRPGILGWNELATLFARVADFYAGYGPAADAPLGAWLDACTDATAGKPWAEAAMTAHPAGGTCGEAFRKITADYRAAARAAAPGSYKSRVDERVGDASALHKVISTSVLEGDAVGAYQTARAAYKSGAHPTGNIPFTPSFSDIKFGYWGSDADLKTIARNDLGTNDLKTQKLTSLGNATWRQILQASPAEPGLSRFVELADGRISAGGWSDLAPTLVLKNLGCENVIYVQREGDESQFATKIAKHLGMNEQAWSSLFDLSNPKSAYSISVASAEGVWCTNWNSFGDTQIGEMALDAYSAPLEVRTGFHLDALSPYPRTTERTGRPGCTPGVGGGATFPR